MNGTLDVGGTDAAVPASSAVEHHGEHDGDRAQPATLVRLAASGGRSDRLRIGLTAIGAAAATVMLLTAAAVAFISDGDGPYRLDVIDQPGLRLGVMIAILMLTVPIVVFVGLCTRVGAPARDRRLSMFRMAGATPGDVTRIAALETAIATGIGSIIGLVMFHIGRVLLDSESLGTFTITAADGSTREGEGLSRLLPTDVAIPWFAQVAVVVLLVIGATMASAVALRSVRVSPFGVTRIAPKEPPTARAALLFAIGSGGLVVLGGVTQRVQGDFLPVILGAVRSLRGLRRRVGDGKCVDLVRGRSVPRPTGVAT